MAAPQHNRKKHERLWDATMALGGLVGLLLGVSTAVNGGLWRPAAIVAGGYLVACMLIGGYVGIAGRRVGTGNEAHGSSDGVSRRRPLAWAGVLTGLALLSLLLQDAVRGGVPNAVFWIGGITLVAIGLAISALSVAHRQ